MNGKHTLLFYIISYVCVFRVPMRRKLNEKLGRLETNEAKVSVTGGKKLGKIEGPKNGYIFC